MDTGAIQCGYCTPAMILAARLLLQKTANPTRKEVETALSGILCRCTGYHKPVNAVLKAAAILRGDSKEGNIEEATHQVTPAREIKEFFAVGKSARKVDAQKLVQGNPAFTDDIEMRGMLIARVLHSPVAHARIKSIDTTQAKALARGCSGINLSGYSPRHLFYCRTIRSNPRTIGYLFTGFSCTLCGRPGGDGRS